MFLLWRGYRTFVRTRLLEYKFTRGPRRYAEMEHRETDCDHRRCAHHTCYRIYSHVHSLLSRPDVFGLRFSVSPSSKLRIFRLASRHNVPDLVRNELRAARSRRPFYSPAGNILVRLLPCVRIFSEPLPNSICVSLGATVFTASH